MYTSQTSLFTKTTKEKPKGEVSLNAQLLMRAGFVDKVMAGVYSYLPLGLRVLKKIQQIVREEMDALGGQEILMPALSPKELWETTDRWDKIDVLFKVEDKYALGSTHEEVVTPLVKKFVHSYKDLPVAVYQIQDKFRNEPRAKSGLMRGREFSMKDLYSFHKTAEDFEQFYEKSIAAYHRIFERCGLDAKLTAADGGVFSKFSHEFQVITPYGEDIIFHCAQCNTYTNKEIITQDSCDKCDGEFEQHKAIEVGNIFPLKTRFTDAFNFTYANESGENKEVYMGCYGIGPSRMMGAVVEVHADDAGMVWPTEIAPYDIHVVALGDSDSVMKKAKEVAITLSEHGKEVLLDDRSASAGAKFADSDLFGIPTRIVISEKLVAKNEVEVKQRTEKDAQNMSEADVYSQFAM